MPRRFALALLLALAAARAAPASAEPADAHIEEARRHLENLELDQAQEALEAGLAAGGSDRARLVEIHRMLGIVHASLDRPERAVDHFRRLLALDPAAEVAAELGPKIGGPFADARASMTGRQPLSAHIEPLRRGARELVVRVDSDPAAMVASGRAAFVLAAGDAPAASAPGAARMAFAVPTGALRAAITLLDEHGNRLAELDAELAAPAPPIAPPPAEGEGDRPAPPILARWPVWAGVAVGLAALGGGLALEARSTRSELDDLEDGSSSFSDAEDRDAHGRRFTLLANASFAAAGAAAIASAVLFFRF